MIYTFRMATKAFIENEDGEILVVRESAEYEEGTNAGKWQIPGGRLDPGEKYEEALKREVREETGLEVELGDPITLGEWRPEIKEDKFQIVAVFFRCETEDREVELSHEHTAYRWICPENHTEYDFIGNLPEKFQKYMEVTESELPKLVRDRIPEVIRENDKEPEARKVSDEEEKWLREKVLEEAEEFAEEGEKEELADLYAVLQEYMDSEDISFSKLEDIEEEKASERGGFKQRIVLEDVKDE
jgi:predicted house-cleaning noncanonical NTP pyrophosphatase (MazG superfamily)/8-oxo-dGTP pyrophosphatase MutT (NUDIX family)